MWRRRRSAALPTGALPEVELPQQRRSPRLCANDLALPLLFAHQELALKASSMHGKLSKTNAGEVAEWLKAAVC